MNAIEFLLKEHDKIRKTFKEISKISHREDTKKEMFDNLCQELLIHESMEQKIWYPHLMKIEKLNGIIKHLIAEEKDAEKAMKQFAKVKSSSEWEAKYRDFRNDVENHASEEENKLFPKVKELLDEKSLQGIGKQMREYKVELHFVA